LSTTLSIILLFGGIIGVKFWWKYRAKALALREIKQGIFLSIYYSFISIVYIIISCHHALNIIVTS
jgi:hypothetical protein